MAITEGTLDQRLADYGLSRADAGVKNKKVACPSARACGRRKLKDPCVSISVDDDGKGFVADCKHCSKPDSAREDGGSSRPFAKVPKKLTPVPKQYDSSRNLTQEAVAFFESRKIPAEIAEDAHVTSTTAYFQALSSEAKAIAFPYYFKGEVVAIKYRGPQKAFTQAKNPYPVLWGIDDVNEKFPLVICEGEIDKLTLDYAAVPNAVSVPNGVAKRREDAPGEPVEGQKDFLYVEHCADIISRFSDVILAVDGDEAGKYLADELARRIGPGKCRIVSYPDGCKDPNDVLQKLGVDAVQDLIHNARPVPIPGVLAPYDVQEGLEELLYNGPGRALTTGFKSLDRHLMLDTGLFMVVTAAPSSGKSQWIDALMINMAKLHGWTTAMCSFENDPREHMLKLVQQIYGRPLLDPRTMRVSISKDELDECVGQINSFMDFIRIPDEQDATLDTILELAEALVLRKGIKMLVIDPYNEISHYRDRSLSETEYISQFITKLKRFAMARGVLVILVAHPRKLGRDSNGNVEAPTLYDVAGSAHFYNKADIGVIMERMRDEEGNDTGRTRVITGKVRHARLGTEGSTELHYNRDVGIYEEIQAEKAIYSAQEALKSTTEVEKDTIEA